MHNFHVKKLCLCTHSFTYAKSPGYISGCSDHILFDYNNKVLNLLTEHCSTCIVQSMQYEDDKNRVCFIFSFNCCNTQRKLWRPWIFIWNWLQISAWKAGQIGARHLTKVHFLICTLDSSVSYPVYCSTLKIKSANGDFTTETKKVSEGKKKNVWGSQPPSVWAENCRRQGAGGTCCYYLTGSFPAPSHKHGLWMRQSIIKPPLALSNRVLDVNMTSCLDTVQKSQGVIRRQPGEAMVRGGGAAILS